MTEVKILVVDEVATKAQEFADGMNQWLKDQGREDEADWTIDRAILALVRHGIKHATECGILSK